MFEVINIKTEIHEAISKLRTRQARPSILAPVSGVEGHACHDHFLSFEISSHSLLLIYVPLCLFTFGASTL